MGDWDDKEIWRFTKRVNAMIEAVIYHDDNGRRHEGISLETAEATAQQMLYRDRPGSGDDRRVCFECKHLDGRLCKVLRFEPVRTAMQRCDRFELKAVKKAA